MNMLENPNAIASILPGADPACFDSRWMLGPQVGRDTSSNFALSFDGRLAIRTADNRFVVPKRDLGGVVTLEDVTCLTINVDPCVYRIPMSIDAVRPGHVLVRSDSPFSLLVVEQVARVGNSIQGVDPRSEEKVEILIPDKSLGIPSVLVRVVSLFDGFDGFLDSGAGDATRPDRLNGLLPLLLLSGQGGGLGGVAGGNNLAVLALAFSKTKKVDSRLALLLALAGSQTNNLTQTLLLATMMGSGFTRETEPPSGRATASESPASSGRTTAGTRTRRSSPRNGTRKRRGA